MRFALMIEPQQGLSYGDQVAIAKRAEANGFEALFRSDHYASFPGATGQPTTDAWTVIAGLARETDRIGAGRARLAGHVPARRHVRQDRHDRRRDERRPDRGRRRGRLERARAPPAGPRRSRRSASGWTPSRTSSRSCTGCGASPDGWSYEGRTVTIRDALFYPKPVAVPGRPVGADRRGPPVDHLRGLRRAARRPADRGLVRRVQHARAARPQVAENFAKLDAACAAIGRDPVDAGALGDGRRARRTHRRGGPGARPGAARGVRRRCRRRLARGAPRPLGRRAPASRPARWSAGSPRPASSGSCSRTSSPGTSTTST